MSLKNGIAAQREENAKIAGGHAMNNGRRYRDAQSYPIPVWSGLLEHRPAIRGALWTFVWCLDKVTREEGGRGFVLGDKPVKVEQIAADLQLDECTVRRDLKRLVGRYLEVLRTPYGLRIRVLNSAKFNIWRSGKNARSEVERSGETADQIGLKRPDRSGENARGKEDTTGDSTKTQQNTLFELFWAAHPRKVAKLRALKAWRRIKAAEVPALMAALERHKHSPQWDRDGGQFIPHPATWLNERRWEDEDQQVEKEANRAEQRDSANLRTAGFTVN